MTELLSQYYSSPFWLRLLVVLLVLSVIAVWDRVRNSGKATRWKEYLFWVSCGFAGSIIAIANDLITSSISEKYFTLGKGLPGGESLTDAVIPFACEAGFLVGIIAGGLVLLVNSKKPGLPQLGYRKLAVLLLLPVGAAILFAPAGAFVGPADLFGLTKSLEPVMATREVHDFLTVQGIHTGLYAGAVLGIVGAMALVRRMRHWM